MIFPSNSYLTPMMRSPSPTPRFLLPIHRGMGRLPAGLAMLCLTAGISATPPSFAATPGEVCSVDAIPADELWHCTTPAAVAGVTTIFWAPQTCPIDMEATIPASPLNIRFVLFNSKPSVILSATGTTNSEVLVGSPNASDDLQGSGGKNTYVVGGQSSYLLGRGDRAFIYSTSGEMDWVGLSSSAAEFIHISGSLQGNPGNISLASMAGLQPVRGSNEISGTLATCLTAKLLSTGREGLIAQGDPSPPPSQLPCSECVPASQRVRKGLAGAPTLQGFPLAPANMLKEERKIFLPAQDYLFQGSSLSRQKSIPILVASSPSTVAPSKLVSKVELDREIQRSDGLTRVRSNAPLVYFPGTGLLVFSQNNSPLGSSGNPGRIIARLLQRDGTPSKAPVKEGEVFRASFVTFTPGQAPR